VKIDFKEQRANMIESQIRTNDVSDLNLIGAINAVKREDFVDPSDVSFAYAEVAVKSKNGRLLLKPRDFAKLAQAAKLKIGDEVLIVGGLGGYSCAVFSALGANATVLDSSNNQSAGANYIAGNLLTLSEVGEKAFDAIFVDGGVEYVPTKWGDRLKENGRLCVIVVANGIGEAKVFVKSKGQLSSRTIFDAQPPILTELSVAKEFVF
jgi:protein-L-isoaspartate(D-aspartate) O-methyltransferase